VGLVVECGLEGRTMPDVIEQWDKFTAAVDAAVEALVTGFWSDWRRLALMAGGMVVVVTLICWMTR
jgi:hypothetical protein